MRRLVWLFCWVRWRRRWRICGWADITMRMAPGCRDIGWVRPMFGFRGIMRRTGIGFPGIGGAGMGRGQGHMKGRRRVCHPMGGIGLAGFMGRKGFGTRAIGRRTERLSANPTLAERVCEQALFSASRQAQLAANLSRDYRGCGVNTSTLRGKQGAESLLWLLLQSPPGQAERAAKRSISA